MNYFTHGRMEITIFPSQIGRINKYIHENPEMESNYVNFVNPELMAFCRRDGVVANKSFLSFDSVMSIVC